MTLRILLLGGGDVGSAVAHRLYLHGADVVIADREAPPHPRRGMALTDAWVLRQRTLLRAEPSRAMFTGCRQVRRGRSSPSR